MCLLEFYDRTIGKEDLVTKFTSFSAAPASWTEPLGMCCMKPETEYDINRIERGPNRMIVHLLLSNLNMNISFRNNMRTLFQM
jgi:hypothetical protein